MNNNHMSIKERNLIPECIKVLMRLPPELQERIYWVASGMLLAINIHSDNENVK